MEKPAPSPKGEEAAPATSDIPPAPGDMPPASPDLPPAPSDIPPAVGDMPAPPTDLPPAASDLPPAIPIMPPSAGAKPPPKAAAGTPAAAKMRDEGPPPTGSKITLEKNLCAMCHTESAVWEGDTRRYYIPLDKLKDDVHWQAGVVCSDCHGGDYTASEINQAHASDNGFRPLEEVTAKACDQCHHEPVIELRKGVHAKAGGKDERGLALMMQCGACHGEVSHHLLPRSNPASPVFITKQIETCGECHEKDKASYVESVHGNGLYKSGLLVTAACADCHGAHGIYRAADNRSTLYPANVAKTCGHCHRFIQERLEQSVHGRKSGLGEFIDGTAAEGTGRRTPTCTSCHQGHEIVDPESLRFRLLSPNLCGNCHVKHSLQYGLSLHGALTELGYGPAAKCSDCHGAHSILPVAEPASSLSAENRAQTCGKCHPKVTANFLDFDPHADHTDPESDPIVHWVYTVLLTLLFTTFGVFGLHSLLWFIRGIVDVLKHGRPRRLKPGEAAFVRFKPFHRQAHTLMLISFLGLALTGMPLKYSHQDWAKGLAYLLGGFDSTSVWHRIFGILTIASFVVYLVHMFHRYRRERAASGSRAYAAFGPDSPLPTWRDFKDFGRMLRWFVGLGPKPSFERWAYWEKFDFWGACADIVIIGTTGLILWFPNLVCAVLPGVTLNIAKVIHSTQALLATGFVFAIHFFNTHFRAEKFPVDMSVLTGLVSEEEMEEERADYLERLRREGRLEEFRTTVPSRRRLTVIHLGGFIALAIGLTLLVAMVITGMGH